MHLNDRGWPLSLRSVARVDVLGSMCVRGAAIALKSLQVVLLVRLFGAEGFGVYSVALGVFGLAMAFAQLGLEHYVQRGAAALGQGRVGRDHVRIGRLLVLPGLLAALLAQAVVSSFYAVEVSHGFSVLCLAAPIHAMTWNRLMLLRGTGCVNQALALDEVVRPAVLVVAAFFFRDLVLGLFFAFLASSLVVFISVEVVLRRLVVVGSAELGNLDLMKCGISASKSFYANQMLESLSGLADGLIVGYLLQPVEAGLYAIATRMSGMVLSPIAIVTIYMKNTAAKMMNRELGVIWREVRVLALACWSLSVALWLVVMSILPWVGDLFDTDYPPPAEFAYACLVTARALQGWVAPANSVLFMSGREHYVRRISQSILPLYLIVLILLTHFFGLGGVGVSVLLLAIATLLATLAVLKSET